MSNNLLEDYRRRLLERYRRQVTRFAEHPALRDAQRSRVAIKPGEWSAHQVLFHTCLVDEKSYGPRLGRVLREDRPMLEDFDADRWMDEHYDPAEAVAAILDRWRRVRDEVAAEAEAAPPEDWSRTGRQPFWGERTAQWWIERAVAHADDHWRQLNGE